MPLYRRKFPCSVCGKPVYWDSDRQLLSCGCGTSKATFVNLEAFEQLPKYARHIRKAEFPIDSISFFDGKFMHISDQRNNEEPHMVVSFINYPKERRVQLRLAFHGRFHKEKLSYNTKDPKDWKEKVWIIIPIEELDRILQFLQNENPMKLASWM